MKEGKQYARLAAYAAAAGAALASAGTADAAILYTSVNVPAGGDAGKIITGTNFRARVIASNNGGSSLKAGYMVGNAQYKINVGGRSALLLTANQAVGPGLGFGMTGLIFYVGFTNTNKFFNRGQFPTSSAGGYIGIRFGADGDANKYYGWMHIAKVNRTGPSFSIDGWAKETTANLPIQVGATGPAAVPEPTSCALALIALGAGGLAVHRRRRQEREALQDQAA